jgi:hypothetical protein
MSIERARLLIKRGNGKPTIPTSNDHTDGTWLTTDIYVGEQYLDLDTGVIYTRGADDDIRQVNENGLVGVFKALISQDGTNAPVINAIQSDNIGFVSASRADTGIYFLTFESNSFPNPNLVNIQITNGLSPVNQGFVGVNRSNEVNIRINTYDSSAALIDSRLSFASISIEVYAPQTIS